jgi:PmbA protein
MSSHGKDELFALGDRIVRAARALGADVAEAVISEGSHLSAKVRLGQPELVEEAGSRAIGVRVMVEDAAGGFRVAVSYSSDTSEQGIARLAEDAVELARLSEPDAFAGPPEPGLLSSESEHADLDLFDPKIDEIDGAMALAHAKNGEAAALGADPRVTNSEGATFSRASGAKAIVTSGGFRGYSRGTYASLTASFRTKWSARRQRGERSRSSARERSRPRSARSSSIRTRRARSSGSSRARSRVARSGGSRATSSIGSGPRSRARS